MDLWVLVPDDVNKDDAMHDDGDPQEEGPVGVGDCLEADAPVARLSSIDGAWVDSVNDGAAIILKIEVTEENFYNVDDDSVDRERHEEHFGG